MKVIYGNSNFRLKRSVVAIGIFDGLHRGHQFLLSKMLHKAKALGLPSLVVTFFPHPVHVLRPDIQLGYLISLAHRFVLLRKMGVDYCYVVPFDKRFAHVEPSFFITDFLVKRLHVADIFVGADFRFGRDRMGDLHLFEKLANDGHYKAHGVAALMEGNEAISSTRVRQLIIDGDLIKAKKLLGRPFSVLGEVVKGSARGRELGFPTANVQYENDILPPLGVYAVRVLVKNRILKGVANVGIRPTFKEKNPKVSLEVFILGFKGNLYGTIVEVEFIKKIRDEKKFSSRDGLIAQIQKDVVATTKILK